MAHIASYASHRLRSLTLTRCTSITDYGFSSWTITQFPRLEHLVLADCTYLSDHAIVALVQAANQLTHLDLSFCCALSDTATQVVALGLPRLRDLKLAFCGSAVSDMSLGFVARHSIDLERLSIRGCVRVTGEGIEGLLAGCVRLEHLDLSQCRSVEEWLDDGGVARWGFDSRGAGARRAVWPVRKVEEVKSPVVERPVDGQTTGVEGQAGEQKQAVGGEQALKEGQVPAQGREEASTKTDEPAKPAIPSWKLASKRPRRPRRPVCFVTQKDKGLR